MSSKKHEAGLHAGHRAVCKDLLGPVQRPPSFACTAYVGRVLSRPFRLGTSATEQADVTRGEYRATPTPRLPSNLRRVGRQDEACATELVPRPSAHGLAPPAPLW